jgi:hypothetical protein
MSIRPYATSPGQNCPAVVNDQFGLLSLSFLGYPIIKKIFLKKG